MKEMMNKIVSDIEDVKKELKKSGAKGIKTEHRYRGISFDLCIIQDGAIDTVFEIVSENILNYNLPLVLSRFRNILSTIPFVRNFIVVCVCNDKIRYYDFSDEVIWKQRYLRREIEAKIKNEGMNISKLVLLLPHIFTGKNHTFKSVNWLYWIIPILVIIFGFFDYKTWYSMSMERIVLLITFIATLLLHRIDEIRIGNLEIKMREQRIEEIKNEGNRLKYKGIISHKIKGDKDDRQGN